MEKISSKNDMQISFQKAIDTVFQHDFCFHSTNMMLKPKWQQVRWHKDHL